MTPAARVQAAIEIIDEILHNGFRAELSLTTWSRKNRYAGSKDRAAIRDHVYGALRKLRSLSGKGGALSGRAILIAALREDGIDPTEIFTGGRFAPVPLEDKENATNQSLSLPEAFDIPDWLWPIWKDDLGDRAEEVADALTRRAPVFLRVNCQKISPKDAVDKLRNEGVISEIHPEVGTALCVTEGQRAIQTSDSYQNGFVELQDASSQRSIAQIPLTSVGPYLDYCAGGGGKTLAMADHFSDKIHAYDASAKRLIPLEERAKRAGAKVQIMNRLALKREKFGLVFADVPCSGSGSWRRDPAGKWRLDAAALSSLLSLQYSIFNEAASHLRSGGLFVYATCSVLKRENRDQIDHFLTEHPQWSILDERQFYPSEKGDGFYFCYLQKP